jgi:hypothetical protein
VDAWTKQTYDVFVSVLKRPRFSITILSEESKMSFNKQNFIVKFMHGSTTYILSILENQGGSGVSCRSDDGVFKFKAGFSSKKSPSMRRTAIVMMKKIEHKEAYDVMMS